MELAKLLDRLGYADSPHFLRRGTAALRNAPEFGHVFRKATGKPCHLEGVYTLRANPESKSESLVPVVYVCHANSVEAADTIHRLVWNQDVVPFLLVHSPGGIRFYSGFRCEPQADDLEQGVLRVLTEFNEVSSFVESFNADAIDSGRIWREFGRYVTPETRVDSKLLKSLLRLDEWLRLKGGLEKDVSHALIGKYVYLYYLRERGILSDERLSEWNLDAKSIFGREATRAGLKGVTERLDAWLNGSVFPLKLRGPDAPDDNLISRVAATFDGDEVVGDSEWQLHLDFKVYDFSYIPIETLSVIYEQFLHAPEADGGKTKGEEAAAYYTPIPVVNFMLAEMDERLPLRRGMKVFDPACGSGAFLVQSYRRLIEREFPDTRKKPTPLQLRELLVGHIFGLDADADACSVTELSLILTLLEYIDPPDLLPEPSATDKHAFKLPTLRDSNIFHSNFFQLTKPAKASLTKTHFEWIVGNPPWKGLDPAELDGQDVPVWKWMSAEETKKSHPCGGYEAAQAFAWRVGDFMARDGALALLLPAMTLFEDRSRHFRSKFFQRYRVTAVANFSNLAEVLFAGRSRVPSAAFFFGPRREDAEELSEEYVTVFSPLVANQEVTRPETQGIRNATWSLLVSASEIKDVALTEIFSGSGLSWKFAIWGSSFDRRMLGRIARRTSVLKELEDAGIVIVSQGPELRNKPTKAEDTEQISELIDEPKLHMKTLARMRHVFAFNSAEIKPNKDAFLRVRGGRRGLSVCRPPHVIVNVARTFAVFSDQFLIVPPRQIGIVSSSDDEDFLKAMSLYLSSDFAYYHQFLTSTQFGVQREVATLNALRSIPIPIANLTREQLQPWVKLHTKLLKTVPINMKIDRIEYRERQKDLFEESDEDLGALLKELNALVAQSLGLDDREQALVHDLVHVRLELNDGKIGAPAIRPPTSDELNAYARRLKTDLDSFVGEVITKRHQIGIVYDTKSASAMVQIDLMEDKVAAREIFVVAADKPTSRQLEKTRQRLRKLHSQWVYFDRNLRIYEGTKTFVFKPLQRFHWTESQAMQDASEIIAETLQGGDEPS